VKIIDLRSDTLTLPTDAMRQAMYEAELGDDVYQEDPTVNSLEEMAARMLGKEAALFTPSGTMSNLIAVLTHTKPGDEIILGNEAHIFWYEVGGASALAGVVMHTVPNDLYGRIEAESIREAIQPNNIHHPRTRLLCLENTHNRCGGAVLNQEYMASFYELAHQQGLRVHLDGARIFNAAVALNAPASELSNYCDSVCFCLSKGLGAPVGSLLCGNEDFIAEARRWRKMLGGGMRQAGILAAAGIVALETMVNRLAEDHANARQLACGLERIPGLFISPDMVQSNIVMFEVSAKITASKLVQKLEERGVRLLCRSERLVRAVTHYMVNEKDIEEALSRIESIVKTSA
jgi:threonine aldolase